MKRTCENCRYWSEMVASFTTDLEAACLSDGPHTGKMTPRWHNCQFFADNALGAIDAPGVDVEKILALYARHDGRSQEVN